MYFTVSRSHRSAKDHSQQSNNVAIWASVTVSKKQNSDGSIIVFSVVGIAIG